MRTLLSRLAAVVVLGAVLAGTGGCTQTLAYMMAMFAPPKKVSALYEPPKGKKYLVFVDDHPSPVSWEPIKHELASRIGRRLQQEKIASGIIPYERLQDLSSSRDFERMSIAEAGQKLGADVVLYVQIDQFALREPPRAAGGDQAGREPLPHLRRSGRQGPGRADGRPDRETVLQPRGAPRHPLRLRAPAVGGLTKTGDMSSRGARGGLSLVFCRIGALDAKGPGGL